MLSPSDRTLLLGVAREQIESALERRDPNLPPRTAAVSVPCGAFVTLRKREAGQLSLRGCIGQIEAAQPLYDTVAHVARSSAFSDYRFRPVTAEEWPAIQIEISALSPLDRIDDARHVRPGEHGLYVRTETRSGLLLPQVATERNWDRETFLAQTCRKAGLPEDAWRDPDTEIYVFTADVFDETPVVS